MRWKGILLMMAVGLAAMAARDVVLVRDGKARAAVVVPAGLMADDVNVNIYESSSKPELDRRLVRESARDLAIYLGKVGGSEPLEIVEGELPPKDKRLPIYVGAVAEAKYGPATASDLAKQGFRVVVTTKGIGLLGESSLATSYAVYEVLDRLGCRWYMPSDMGECLPSLKEVALPVMDMSKVPDTLYRGVWYATPAFKRRNRTGGLYLNAGHALETTITKEDREQHPEWKAVVGGKVQEMKIKWTHPGVAKAIADHILESYAKNPRDSYSLSPMDGIGWDESLDPQSDAGDWDPIAGTVSKTDRLLVLENRVAEQVTKVHPNLLFGFLVYADYTRPPVREKINPALVGQIAPILYNRAHPMTWKDHPNGSALLDLVDGWAAKADKLSYYWYAYNLAEISAPNPFMTKWGTDVPMLMDRKCQFWMPETISNFETINPGLYMSLRVTWDKTVKPEDVFKEYFQRFYGAAAVPMEAYWRGIDRAWIESREYSGSGFGYLRIFTPEVLAQSRELMDQGLAACQTIMEFRRVQMADASLKQLELFMKMRRDLTEGRLTKLATDAANWRASATHLAREYDAQYGFGGHRWARTWHIAYFDSFFAKPIEGATEMAKDNRVLTPKPIREWRFHTDPNADDPALAKTPADKRDVRGIAAGWQQPGFDDSAWKTTDVGVETWSTIGLHSYLGDLWYRATVKLPPAPGKRIHLWIASTDGSAQVFVNGKHVPWKDAKGELKDAFNGYCTPASFDITDALEPGKPAQISLLCRRAFMNELGTGGLLAPVYVYADK